MQVPLSLYGHIFLVVLVFLCAISGENASAFTIKSSGGRAFMSRTMNADSWQNDHSSSGGGAGSLEQIEFKIYSDGRIEETVRGVKGNNCHKITDKINEALGEVVASEPTEEMYEQELEVSETLYQTDSSSDWEGSSSW